MLRRGDASALLTGIALLPGLLRILLLLMLRLLATALLTVLTTAWIVFMGALSELRALLRIGHLQPPGIFIPYLVRFTCAG
jgi:pheromone shutdown protein TraB